MDPAEVLVRRVARAATEATHVNTINVNDRVTINFVWYPGAQSVQDSLVDTIIDDAPDGTNRWVNYRWERTGQAAVSRPLLTGRVTLALPPGQTGVLTCFGTSWQITRAANAVQMAPVNTVRGVQQRLDRLGYHLRNPGARQPGTDNLPGQNTEIAILRFQTDYRPAAGAAAPANSVLKVRGESNHNTNGAYTGNLQQYNGAVAVAPNPSLADGPALQASLVARVGA